VAPTNAPTRIERLRQESRAAPEDLSLAVRYWRALANIDGADYRSAARLLDALRTSACLSPEGAYEFALGYVELLDLTGEVPELDEPLRMALIGAIGSLPIEKAVVVESLVVPNSMGSSSDVYS
jgi:hypothetical protein